MKRIIGPAAWYLAARAGPGGVGGLPPILAFQSVADATVSTPALVGGLFRRLAPEGHELVLFDINRVGTAAQFVNPAVIRLRGELLGGAVQPFDLTLLSAEDATTRGIVEFRRAAGSTGVQRAPTGLAWPDSTFSLSHDALPFAPDDPLYGAERPAAPGALYLGRLSGQGERGVIPFPPTAFLRLRHNPFFGYLAARVEAFTTSPAPAP